MAKLERLLREPLPRGVLLHGKAGVGKTRVLGEFATRSVSMGWAVERITGNISVAELPLGVLAGLLPDEMARPGAGHAFERVVGERLIERHDGRRVVVAVDDVQSVDRASASLLAGLTDRGFCFLAASARSEEPWPRPVRALVKDQILEPIEIGVLHDDAIADLLRSALGGPVDPATTQRIQGIVGGNPLFLRELIEHSVESGAMSMDGGHWALVGDPSISPTLERIIDDRIGALSAEERAAVELLATAYPLELELARTLVAPEVLTELERRHVVAVFGDERRRFLTVTHPLLAEVIRRRTPTLQQQASQSDLIAAVGATGARRRGDPLRLGTWHLRAGDSIPCEVLVAAASQANAAGDHALAERLAEAAADVGAGVEATLIRADAISRQGRVSEAEAMFSDVFEEIQGGTLIAEVAAARAENIGLRGGDVSTAIEILEAARAVSDPGGRLGIDVLMALLLAWKPDIDSALEVAYRVIDSPGAPPPLVAEALSHVEMLSLWRNDFPEAIAATERGLALVETHADIGQDVVDRLALGPLIAKSLDGEVAIAIHGLRAGYRDAMQPPISAYAGLWATWLSFPLRLSGAVRSAVEIADQAVRLIERSDPTGMYRGVVGLAGVAAAEVLDERAVERAIEGMRDGPPPPPPRGSWDPWLEARLALLGSDREAGRLLIHRAIDAAVDEGHAITALWILSDAVRLDPCARCADLAVQLVDGQHPALLSTVARQLDATVSGDDESLAACASEYLERGESLMAVYALLQLVELWRAQGNEQAAARAATRARHVAATETQLPSAVVAEAPAFLTGRETEIAYLARDGLSSREIAARLHISVRTVDNHLASVYTKLGLHGRDELPLVLESQRSGAIRP